MGQVHAPVRPWSRTELRVSLAAFVAVCLLVGVFLLRDASSFITSPHRETFGHAGASAAFTLAAAGTFLALRGTRPTLPQVLLGGAALTALGELVQIPAPVRTAELSDLLVGLGGVLVSGLLIEVVLQTWDALRALRFHAVVAGLASIFLAVVLVLDLRPTTIFDAAPDGDTCPLTTITGDGTRVSLGPDLRIEAGCLRTSTGGFGLWGPDGQESLGSETVLVSSPLDELGRRIAATSALDFRSQITTPRFDDDQFRPGVLAILRSDEAGEVLHVRVADGRLEVYGPDTTDIWRGASLVQGVGEDATVSIEVSIRRDTLTTWIDGVEVARTRLDSAWPDEVREGDLQLLVGNNADRTLPMHGTIDWIEIEAG